MSVSLISAADNQALKKRGYHVLRSFLSDREVDSLLEYYEHSGLNATLTQPNYLYAQPDKSREVSSAISQQVGSAMKRFFASGRLLGGVFMVKQTGPKCEMDYHQDWSLVDETEHISYNLWCALTDTGPISGGLSIMEKSHLIGFPYRSSSIPPLEISHGGRFDKYVKTFTLKAGDAIIYRHSMFHGSGNNTSGYNRIAIACGIIPEDATFIYQHWNEQQSVIESYQVDNAFYIDHIHEVLSGSIPDKYPCVGKTLMDRKPQLDEEELLKRLRSEHGIKRLFSLNW